MTSDTCLRVIGLMSGTSMDGIDVAFVETDGESLVRTGAFTTVPYPEELRCTLLRLPAPDVARHSLQPITARSSA